MRRSAQREATADAHWWDREIRPLVSSCGRTMPVCHGDRADTLTNHPSEIPDYGPYLGEPIQYRCPQCTAFVGLRWGRKVCWCGYIDLTENMEDRDDD